MLRKEKNQRRSVVREQPTSSESMRSSDSYETRRNENNHRNIGINPQQRHGQAKLLRGLNHNNKASMSVGRKEAFESFVRDYPENELIEENKRGLKMRYAEAKKLGEQVNSARQEINTQKSKIEKLKMRRSLQVAAGTRSFDEGIDEEEQSIRATLDDEKHNYKRSFNQLKTLKTEIEHMQFLLEKSKVKLQKDFEIWWSEQVVAMDQGGSTRNTIKTAWRTPPLPSTTTGGEVSTPNGDTSRFRESQKRFSIQSSDTEHGEVTTKQSASSSLSTRNAFVSNFATEKNSTHVSTTAMEGERSSKSAIRLTGDAKTDEDIMAFMKARQQLMNRSGR